MASGHPDQHHNGGDGEIGGDHRSGHQLPLLPRFRSAPLGYGDVWAAERAEIDRERVRIWYVAATRAREVLILPRLGSDAPTKSWKAVVDLRLDELPTIAITKLPPGKFVLSEEPENEQTREGFALETSRIHHRQRRLEWMVLSLDEEEALPLVSSGPGVLSGDDEGSMLPRGRQIQGGPDRGLILHKLLEEVLSGETPGNHASLAVRAEELIREIGREPVPDPTEGLSSSEIVGCVTRALALPEVVALRSRLVHEFPVYSVAEDGRGELVTAGIADAVALGANGQVDAVIDWKSDVAPSPEAVEKYRRQVRVYLDALNFRQGLIVFVTTGEVVSVGR